MIGACRASPAMNRAATASSWRTCPKRNARRNVPSVEGARTPSNSRGIPPWRSTSMSAIESAPATMPATSADTFAPAATPAPPGTVRCASASSLSPARCGQRHRRDQPGARHEIRIIEHSRPHRRSMR